MLWLSDHNHSQDEFMSWLEQLMLYINSIDPNPHLWIDIGANIGQATDLMIKNSKDNDLVWAFEPHPELFSFLHNKYKSQKNVVIWPLAVNDRVGNADFYSSVDLKHSSTSHLTSLVKDGNTAKYHPTPTSVVTLDSFDYENIPNVNFIKIDAESNDFLILQGAKKLLEKQRPFVIFEFSGMVGGSIHNYNAKTWYNFFKSVGYHLRAPVNGHDEKYIVYHYNQYSPELINLLAVPNEKKLSI